MTGMRPKILIVEDEPDVVSALQSYLGRRGFQVSTTASGVEALLLIEASQPDVVILDFSINDISGQDVLKRLREKDQNTRVVIITGQMLSDDEIHAIHQLGIEKYFHKPIVLDNLGKVIGKLTGQDLTVPHDLKPTSKIDCSGPERSSHRKDFHALVNLLGIIRNKCENFILNCSDGIYQGKSDQELLEISDDIMKDVVVRVDDAMDVIRTIRKKE